MLRLLVVVVSLSYPLIVYFGLQFYSAGLLLPLLFALLLVRTCISRDQNERVTLLSLVLALGLVVLLTSPQAGMKLYPVFLNLGLLGMFVGSLFQSQTFVERLARLQEPDLPPAGVLYTRKVTWVWSGFFLLNAAAALITALWMSDEAWALYNGGIAYALIGLLMAGEWLVRRRIKRI